MVKFQGPMEDDFNRVADHLFLMSERAQEKVSRNWARWDESKGV